MARGQRTTLLIAAASLATVAAMFPAVGHAAKAGSYAGYDTGGGTLSNLGSQDP